LGGYIASVVLGLQSFNSEPDTGLAMLHGTGRARWLWTKPDPNPNVKNK
jgi:hypothetical protein